jgi:hypothetical protein
LTVAARDGDGDGEKRSGWKNARGAVKRKNEQQSTKK